MTTEASAERGSVLLMMMTVMLAALYLGILVIDLARAEFLSRALQSSVDAASLAAATELVLASRTDTERWMNSKRAALAVLRENLSASGIEAPSATLMANHRGPADSCESLGDYRSQIYDDGKIRVVIERGHYIDDETGFTRREDSTTCSAAQDPKPNSVRVTVTAHDFPAIFGVFFGLSSGAFGPITRTAIGTRIL